MTTAQGSDLYTFQWLADHRRGWQCGEQGVLGAIVDAIQQDIPEDHRWAVEFGAGNGVGLPVTCEHLIRRDGWRGLLIESDPESAAQLVRNVKTSTVVMTEAVGTGRDGDARRTIDAIMDGTSCPRTPAVMVIDTDGFDYYIVQTMQARPYVLCVETLDTYCAGMQDEPFVPEYDHAGKLIPGPGGVGFYHACANTKAFDALVVPMGYTLAFRSNLNSIYVRDDIVGKVARKPDGEIRLNIGAGLYNDPRFIALDIKTGTDARKLPYETGSVAEVYSSHLLEHFPFTETEAVLREWVRVLKPGGAIRIAVPDARKLAERIIGSGEASPAQYRLTEMMVQGGHSDENDVHRALFTEERLREVMHRCGIGFVRRFDPFIEGDCSNLPVSLNLMGEKRHFPRHESPVITLVLSQPRLTFTGHEIRLVELARRLNFGVEPCHGAFWDRDMTITTRNAIAKNNPDFLMYSDYDSVFEQDDVLRLLAVINNDPTIAAIGAVQMSRHNDRPLVFEDQRDYSGEVCDVDFQHFGLMVIRREVFEEMPQPWFWSIPGRTPQGAWDWDTWNRSDADISFWRNMKELGFRVCQHNGVSIGHIVQCVKYPRDKGRGVQLIQIENYWKTGKPTDAKFNPDLYRTKGK